MKLRVCCEKQAILFLLVYTSSRLILLFTVGDLREVSSFVEPAIDIINGLNPYHTRDLYQIVFPPLFYLLHAGTIVLFGNSSFSFSLLHVSFDVGTLLLIYKIAPFFYKEKKDFIKPALFYAFFPLTLYFIFSGWPQSMALFFLTLGVYAYLRKTSLLAGFFGCLGALTEIYPIFFVYLIGILFLARRQGKEIFHLAGGFLVAFIIVNFPFYGFDLFQAITFLLVHLSRKSTVFSLQHLLPPWDVPITPTFVFNMYTLPPIVFLLLFGIWFYWFVRTHDSIEPRKQFEIFAFFFLFLPIPFMNLYFRYFYWSVPFLAPLFDFSLIPAEFKRFALFVLSILATQLIFITVLFPNYLLLDTLVANELISFESRAYLLLEYLMVLIFLSLIWLFFFEKWLIHGERQFRSHSPFYLLITILIVSLIFFFEYYLYILSHQTLDLVGYICTTCGGFLIAIALAKYFREIKAPPNFLAKIPNKA